MPSYYHFKEFFNRKSIPQTSRVFNNYLDCFFPYLHEKFEAKTIKDFILWMLHDLDYRIHRQAYASSFLNEVQPYFRLTNQSSEFEKLKSFLVPQICNIESREEFLSALEAFYKKENRSIRVLPFQERYGLVLKLRQSGSVDVFVHSSVFVIEKGVLTPLPPLTRLFYTHELELDTSKTHYVYSSPQTFYKIRFLNEPNILVDSMRFPLCNQNKTLKLKNLEDQTDLYSHFKTIENQFIKPKSDPDYQKLIQHLQNCYQLLLVNHYQAVPEAQSSLQKAKQALRNYYSNDRLLLLLVANIEYHLYQKTQKAGRILVERESQKDPFIQDIISSDSL